MLKVRIANTKRRILSRSWLLRTSIAIVVLGASTGGIAFATQQVAQNSGVIHACVNNENGKVRIVPGPSSCRTNEHAIVWNVQGPPGPPGVIHTRVEFTNETLSPGELGIVVARCSAGEVATGGGFGANTALVKFVENSPVPAEVAPPTAWVVTAQNTSATLEIQVVAYAVCTSGF